MKAFNWSWSCLPIHDRFIGVINSVDDFEDLGEFALAHVVQHQQRLEARPAPHAFLVAALVGEERVVTQLARASQCCFSANFGFLP
jgi:hypothetical protein